MATLRTLLNCLVGLFAGLIVATAQAADPADRRPGGVGPEYEVRTFEADGKSLRYGWLTPKSTKFSPDAAGEKYPLVLCLHGKGGNSTAADFLAESKLREQYPCFVVVPDSGTAKWADLPALGRKANGEVLPSAVALVHSLCESKAIDPARIYVTGQSMGGVGSWAAAAKYPDLFAAAVPICGAWNVEEAPKMVPVAVWAFHGELDNAVPVKFSRDLTAALEKAGGNVKYTEYPGVGHGSWVQSYSQPELWAWLFEQRKVEANKQADKK